VKIILSARRFAPPLVGGVDVYTDRLGKALRRMGHEVSVLAVDASAEGSNGAIAVIADELEGTTVRRLTFALSGRPREAFVRAYDPEMGRVIEDILRQERPDLFIVLNFYLVTLAAVEAAKRLDIPVVHIATDFLPVCQRATLIRWNGQPCEVGESIKNCAECFVSHRSLGRAAALAMNHLPEDKLVARVAGRDSYKLPHPLGLLKPYWRQVSAMADRLHTLSPLREQIDLVLTPTRFTHKMFVENGFRPEQVHFLPFGVDEDNPLARIRREPADHTRFLFVGRLQPYKGAHNLLQAFNDLERPRGATLTIYGAADGYDDYFKQLKAQMAGNDRITFGGQIPPDELGQAFAASDYLLLPSLWHENSPLIILDALQSKTPVIASDIGGVSGLIEDGVNGLLFPMGDTPALQRVLQRAIDDPGLAARLRLAPSPPGIDEYAATMFRLLAERRVQRVAI
jgi:glycosyltransferase involved in cell wall biosynthesis